MTLWCMCLKDVWRELNLGTTTQNSSLGAQRPFYNLQGSLPVLPLTWLSQACFAQLQASLHLSQQLDGLYTESVNVAPPVTYLWLFGSLGEELEASRLAFRVWSQTNSLGLCTKAEAVYSGQPEPHWSLAVTHMPMYAKFTKGVVPIGSSCFLVGDRMDMTLSRQERDCWNLCRGRLHGRGWPWREEEGTLQDV